MDVFHMQGTAPMNIDILCLSMSWGKHFGPSQVHFKDNEMDEQRHSMIKLVQSQISLSKVKKQK